MKRYLIPIAYLTLVTLAYCFDILPIFSVLTVPWSLPLIALGGLIRLFTPDAEIMIACAKFMGSFLNVVVYSIYVRRKEL